MPLSSKINDELKKLNELNPADDTGYSIDLDEEGTTIRSTHFSYKHSFFDPQFLKRLTQPNQLLIKACNNKQRSIQSILDLTGGWGMDSFMIAHHGRHVTMLEHSQLIYSLVAHSLNCAKKSPKLTQTVDRINILNTSGDDYLASPEVTSEFDCIYLDPMFPSHKSSAKPGKEMQLLQQMTNNVRIDLAFKLALEKAKNRVVMKRPLKSAPFADKKPDLVYREKTIRFDVYLTA